MSIPANALSDEKCLHYAALDPEAAAELTRSLTSQSITCRDLRIRTKAVLVDAKGKPIMNANTGVPKVGFADWVPEAIYAA